MKANFKTGIALVALAVLALGTTPARADDYDHHDRYRSHSRGDVRIRLDFGRHNDRYRPRYDDHRFRDHHAEERSHYREHRRREEHHYRNSHDYDTHGRGRHHR